MVYSSCRIKRNLNKYPYFSVGLQKSFWTVNKSASEQCNKLVYCRMYLCTCVRIVVNT